MDLKDSVVAITGGGSGLGAATVRAFISAGANVAIVDLPASSGRRTRPGTGQSGFVCRRKRDIGIRSCASHR